MIKLDKELDNTNIITCTICDNDMSAAMIKTRNEHSVEVAYITCDECDNIFNLMFESSATTKIKNKIKVAKEVLEYLQLQLYRENLKAEDVYYKSEYDKLSDADKLKIGEYEYSLSKEEEKNYNEAIRSKKYSFNQLLKLM